MTAHLEWYKAKRAADIIPNPPTSVAGRKLLKLVCETHLTQGDLAGKKFKECLLPWQRKIILWLPHVSEIAIKCGKGSGKSFLTAAIALGTARLWINEGSHRRGLVAILAANVESARIVFSHVAEAIFYDSSIKADWHPNVQQRTLTHKESGIIIQIIPPKLNRAIGLRPALVLLDELHEAAEVQGFEDVVRQLQLGSKNWDDPKQITITTAPPAKGRGYYVEWLTRARAVRDGKVKNKKLLSALFEFPVLERPDLDFEDPKNWYFGMPSLIRRKGAKGTMNAAMMADELKQAQDDIELTGSGNYQALLSQRLGIEASERVGGGLTLLAEYWDGAVIDDVPPGYDRVIIGMDPSEGLRDPFAVVILYGYGDQLRVYQSMQYLTTTGYERAGSHLKKLYDDSIDAGELEVYETDLEIENAVREYCRLVAAGSTVLPEYGGDAAGLAGFSERFGREFGQYIAVPQGWKLLAAFNAAQGALHGGRIKHLGQPLLSENVKNLRLEGSRFMKNDHGTAREMDKIDGIMAALSALYIMEMNIGIDIDAMIG